MRLLKELISSIKRTKSEEIEVSKTLVQIAERNSTIELERGLRENIKEWQRISHIIKCASQKRIEVISHSPEPICHQEWLRISYEERMAISQLIEEFYREREKDLVEKIKNEHLIDYDS